MSRPDDAAPTGGPEARGDPAPSGDPARRWLTPGVASVGATSLLSDAGHELATSLLPTLVTTTLGAGPGALAAIDGVADALTGLSKLAGGPLAAQPTRRGRLASGGYLTTALATGAMGAAVAVWQVAVLRAVAWVARGIRSPARDTLLTGLVPERALGRAFGVERAGDNLGAIAGPLLGAVLVGLVGVRHALWLSIVPGALAAVAITVAAREARRTLVTAPDADRARARLRLEWHALRRAGMVRTLAPMAAFEAGNLATTLLILRATGVLESAGTAPTRAVSIAIVLYAVHNAVAAGVSFVAGTVADRAGGHPVLAAAAIAYVGGYALFAVGGTGTAAAAAVTAGFVLAGAGIGLAETAESALVARSLPVRLRAQGFGVLGLVQAGGDLAATVVAGLLWSAVSAAAAFGYAAAWMVVCLAVVGTIRRPG